MNEATYEHPLYSFFFVPEGAGGPDELPFAIPVAGGRLMVRRSLRGRGTRMRSAVCERAVTAALSLHDQDAAGFVPFGMGPPWAESMRYWLADLVATEGQIAQLGGNGRLSGEGARDLMRRGADLWQHLRLSARLCGEASIVPPGRPPGGRLQLHAALDGVCGRAQEHAAALARYGFGPAQQAELAAVHEALAAHLRQAGQDGWRRGELSARVVVLRSALIGDVSRFSLIAQRVLGQGLAEAARVGKLLSA